MDLLRRVIEHPTHFLPAVGACASAIGGALLLGRSPTRNAVAMVLFLATGGIALSMLTPCVAWLAGGREEVNFCHPAVMLEFNAWLTPTLLFEWLLRH